MSAIVVANVHLEPTANNRIQFGSNSYSFIAGGVTAATVNTSVVSCNLNSYSVNANTVTANYLNVRGENVTPIQSFKNKIINAGFEVWQRGLSNTSIANEQYLADRWKTRRLGTTANVSRQSFTVGQTDVPGEPAYFHRMITTSSAGAGNYCILAQPIESVRTLAGRNYTLTFWAKADTNKSIGIEFEQHFGTGGSPSAGVTGVGQSVLLSSSWQKFVLYFSLPSISGKTLGTNNNDFTYLHFWFDAGSNFNSRSGSIGQQSGTFDIAQVQLEEGWVITPFEDRFWWIEQMLCYRYYNATYDTNTQFRRRNYHLTGTGTGYNIDVKFPVTMRATPTCTIYIDINDGAVTTATGMRIGRWGASGFATLAAGDAVDYRYHIADAEL